MSFHHSFSGSFSCQYVTLTLVRQFQFYLIQTFIPTVLIVVLSWVSFWIDTRAVPARITLGVLSVLTMTTQSSAISQRLPRVSYVKAIDVWTTACLVFVFGSLMEFVLVNYLTRKEDFKRTFKGLPPDPATLPEDTGQAYSCFKEDRVVALAPVSNNDTRA